MSLINPVIKNLGITNYIDTLELMQKYTINRLDNSQDQIWVTEHYPIYTLGLRGTTEDILDNPNSIPICKSDRGGKITYHAPGQIVIYTLIDLDRVKISVKSWIRRLEQAVIDYIHHANSRIKAHRITNQPGVYVDNKKISALGLKIKKGRCYHGISINVNLDLSPFANINPCGYKKLVVTSLATLAIIDDIKMVSKSVINNLID